ETRRSGDFVAEPCAAVTRHLHDSNIVVLVLIRVECNINVALRVRRNRRAPAICLFFGDREVKMMIVTRPYSSNLYLKTSLLPRLPGQPNISLGISGCNNMKVRSGVLKTLRFSIRPTAFCLAL